MVGTHHQSSNMIQQWQVSFPKEALPLWYSKIFSSSSWCNLSSSSYVHRTINHKVFELQRWKLLVACANKKMSTMTPIIDLKRWSSWLKHRITLVLNILLVDCYVGKLLGCNHMVCIWRHPMSNLIDFSIITRMGHFLEQVSPTIEQKICSTVGLL